MTDCRIALEHKTWVLPKVRYELLAGASVRVIEPQVHGEPVTAFVSHMADRPLLFSEDLIAHALQSTDAQKGVSITEIAYLIGSLKLLNRFSQHLWGGGALLWTIAYHDSQV